MFIVLCQRCCEIGGGFIFLLIRHLHILFLILFLIMLLSVSIPEITWGKWGGIFMKCLLDTFIGGNWD